MVVSDDADDEIVLKMPAVEKDEEGSSEEEEGGDNEEDKSESDELSEEEAEEKWRTIFTSFMDWLGTDAYIWIMYGQLWTVFWSHSVSVGVWKSQYSWKRISNGDSTIIVSEHWMVLETPHWAWFTGSSCAWTSFDIWQMYI